MATIAQPVLGNFSNASGTTIAKAYGSNVTAGNLLVVTVAWNIQTQTCTVSGSLNGAFTAIAGSLGTNTTSSFRAQTFFKQNATGGAETITATTSGSNTGRDLVIYEFSGSATTGQPDSSNAATGNTTAPTASITTVAQPGVIVSYCISTLGTIGTGSGYTTAINQNGDGGEYKNYAATGAISVPYTDTSTTQYTITMAAFLDSGGGGGSPSVKQLAALGVG